MVYELLDGLGYIHGVTGGLCAAAILADNAPAKHGDVPYLLFFCKIFTW
jgi:hypothetical protein